ncbi:hypothetical protein DL98DRAFT_578561 [Cadophora sp. DSE1049]|nr:hypothetical protein DL98DRAFT_578561 [Cadophora sp. DSE1049]
MEELLRVQRAGSLEKDYRECGRGHGDGSARLHVRYVQDRVGGLILGVFSSVPLYTSVTGCYMDRNDCREIKKFHDTVDSVQFSQASLDNQSTCFPPQQSRSKIWERRPLSKPLHSRYTFLPRYGKHNGSLGQAKMVEGQQMQSTTC